MADWQWLVRRADRRAIEANLTAVLGEARSARRLGRDVYRNFGKYLIDFLRFPSLTPAVVRECVCVEGLEHLQAALARHGGAISVTAHLGNWELAGAVTAQLGFPVAAVALNHRDPRVNAFFNAQRQSQGVTAIPPGMALRHCQRFLSQRYVVALLGDRNYTGRGVCGRFLGRAMEAPRGPALLSWRTGAPIVPGFLVRTGAARYTLCFEPPLLPQRDLDEAAAIGELTQRYLDVIESYVRRYPTQWFLFRRFDVPETAPDRAQYA